MEQELRDQLEHEQAEYRDVRQILEDDQALPIATNSQSQISDRLDPMDEYENHEPSSQLSSNANSENNEIRLVNRGSEQQRS